MSTIRRRLTSIRLDKIAGVDEPCQEHATVAIIKRAPTGISKAVPQYRIVKATFQEALEGQLVASRVNEAFYSSFNGLWERNDAFRTALTDELAGGGDGAAASADYVDSVKSLVDTAVAAAREAGASATDEDLNKTFTTAAADWLAKKEQTTMKISTRAELLAAVSKFNPSTSPAADIATIQKAATDLNAEDALPAEGLLAKAKAPEGDAELRKRIAVLEMPTEVRKHFDSLDATGQTVFLAKSAEDRLTEVNKANEGDPVLHKCLDGTEIRKSDGPAALAAAKRADALEKRLNDMAGQLTVTTLEKRAQRFPNVAQSVAVEMLKSVDTLGADSEAGKALMASLTSMNKARGGLFKSVGSTAGEGGLEGSGGEIDQAAQAEFNKKVDEVARADKIGRSDAMEKVRVAEPDLFKRAFGRDDEEEEAA